MADGSFEDRKAYISAKAEVVLGAAPERISAPGGNSRSSLRLHYPDHNVIATLRPDFRRTHLEAHVLEELERVAFNRFCILRP